jgi:hypothetical protein
VSSRVEAGARVDPCRVEWKRGESGSVAQETGFLGWWRWGGAVGEETERKAARVGTGTGTTCSCARCEGSWLGCGDSSYAGGRHAMSSCHLVMPSRYAVRPYRYAMSSCQIVMPCACILDHAMRVDRNADSKERCVHVDSKRRENGAEEALWGVITSGGPRDLCASERREREASST